MRFLYNLIICHPGLVQITIAVSNHKLSIFSKNLNNCCKIPFAKGFHRASCYFWCVTYCWTWSTFLFIGFWSAGAKLSLTLHSSSLLDHFCRLESQCVWSKTVSTFASCRNLHQMKINYSSFWERKGKTGLICRHSRI